LQNNVDLREIPKNVSNLKFLPSHRAEFIVQFLVKTVTVRLK